jgi:hypothetical protein
MATPWAVTVLTLDYLIDGQIDGSNPLQAAVFNRNNVEAGLAPLTLTSIQVQPTGSLAVPSDHLSSWTIAFNQTVIGMIPRDEKSAAEFVKYNTLKNTVTAEMVVGPYFIRGTVFHRLNADTLFRLAEADLAMRDIEIDRITPDSKLKGQKVPFMIVRTDLIQGIWFR